MSEAAPVTPVVPAGEAPQEGRSSIPMHVPPAENNYPEISTLIPAEFKDREYLKDVKDVPSLFKKLDGAQTLIGKRPAGIPQDNAKPEEVAAFNKAFGVPEKPEAYELVVPEKDAMPKEMQDGVKKIFHEAELSAKQAKKLSAGWNALIAEQMKAAGAAGAQADADFTKLATETFGDRKDEALAQSKALLEKFAPEKFKTHINGLSNENLIVMAAVLDGIRKEYINEDALPTGKGARGNNSGDVAARRFELMKSKAYQDPFHPDHEATKNEVNRLYGTAA